MRASRVNFITRNSLSDRNEQCQEASSSFLFCHASAYRRPVGNRIVRQSANVRSWGLLTFDLFGDQTAARHGERQSVRGVKSLRRLRGCRFRHWVSSSTCKTTPRLSRHGRETGCSRNFEKFISSMLPESPSVTTTNRLSTAVGSLACERPLESNRAQFPSLKMTLVEMS